MLVCWSVERDEFEADGLSAGCATVEVESFSTRIVVSDTSSMISLQKRAESKKQQCRERILESFLTRIVISDTSTITTYGTIVRRYHRDASSVVDASD